MKDPIRSHITSDAPIHRQLDLASKSGEVNMASGIKNETPPNYGDLLAGMSQLSIMGVLETTSIVEAIHREIALRPFGLFNDKYTRIWSKGISGRVYSLVRSITSLVGKSLAVGINQLSVNPYSQMIFSKKSPPMTGSLKLLINAINGVMGDHLVTMGNPLALPMMLYDIEGDLYRPDTSPNIQTSVQSQTYVQSQTSLQSKASEHSQTTLQPQPKISGRVIIISHGLCMSYLNWQPLNEEGLGRSILKHQPRSTVLYLDYNSGQRISINGRQFADLLQNLVMSNPDISEIDLIGHSMGGLVSRSALYYGVQQGHKWVGKVNKLITLGTPHHGAMLERIGDFVQQTISRLPFAGAISKLGDIRSTGIIDLRHGSIRDEDWKSLTKRSVLADEYRQLTPLPEHILTYFVAGTLSECQPESKAGQILGDGLVNIKSALGEHNEEHTLVIPEGHKAIFYGLSHLALLTDPKVIEHVVQWQSFS